MIGEAVYQTVNPGGFTLANDGTHPAVTQRADLMTLHADIVFRPGLYNVDINGAAVLMDIKLHDNIQHVR